MPATQPEEQFQDAQSDRSMDWAPSTPRADGVDVSMDREVPGKVDDQTNAPLKSLSKEDSVASTASLGDAWEKEYYEYKEENGQWMRYVKEKCLALAKARSWNLGPIPVGVEITVPVLKGLGMVSVKVPTGTEAPADQPETSDLMTTPAEPLQPETPSVVATPAQPVQPEASALVATLAQPLQPEASAPMAPQPLQPDALALMAPQPLQPAASAPKAPQPLQPEALAPMAPQPLQPSAPMATPVQPETSALTPAQPASVPQPPDRTLELAGLQALMQNQKQREQAAALEEINKVHAQHLLHSQSNSVKAPGNDKIVWTTNKKEGMRLKRLMEESTEGAKAFPHMAKMWSGSKED
jgi:hypothetical protein